MEVIAAIVPIVVAIISTAGLIYIAYLQWVLNPRRERAAAALRAEKEAVPSPGDRALERVFTDLDETKELLHQVRQTLSLTQREYLKVAIKLASTEAQLVAALQDIKDQRATLEEKTQEIERLRAILASLRRALSKGT